MMEKIKRGILDIIAKRYSICKHSGKLKLLQLKKRWIIFLFPIMGLAALIWFLIRVIPKPTRINYPCQKIALTVAATFLTTVAGIAAALGIANILKRLFNGRLFMASVSIGLLVILLVTTVTFASNWQSNEGANKPIGTPKGLNPGRVAWVYNTKATTWDGINGAWWSDTNTVQAEVDKSLSKSIQMLAGKTTDQEAWDALFRNFNQTKGFGNTGYTKGEKILVKLNCATDRKITWTNTSQMASPHVIYALVKQLIGVVGANGVDITLSDPSRYIGDQIYNKVRSNPDTNFQQVVFEVASLYAGSGRVAAEPDMNNPIKFVNVSETGYLAKSYGTAKYLINLALLRAHSIFAVTLCAKNHFGSVYFNSSNQFNPTPLHIFQVSNNAMGSAHCHPVLLGHKDLGGKEILYLFDAMYTARTNMTAEIIRWASINNDYCSSIFASQDPVAIDSVGLDFLGNEPNSEVSGTVCNYLHEAAQADNPPSGAFYDPEGDGTRLKSLGVHEHWNNATEKRYTKIDFVKADLSSAASVLLGDVNNDSKVDIVDALLVAQYYVGLAPAGFESTNADVNHNGQIDIVDALLIAQAYVGLITLS